MRGARAAAVAAVVLAGVLAPCTPAAAAPATEQCVDPGTALAQVPWAQERQSPKTIWPVADGAGTTVAVLSSGVDARHEQLAGRVRAGEDYLPESTSGADTDCRGVGTQVAGVIAADFVPNIGFSGLAPGATIVSYRVALSTLVGTGEGVDERAGTPATLAEGIRDATAARPDVLVVPVVTYTDDPGLRAAVAAAIAADIVVVASVGNVSNPEQAAGLPYPAAYDGVVGVIAMNREGTLAGGGVAPAGVDLAAPGDELLSTQAGGGLVEVGGSAIAAGYVAGTAALIRSRWPSAPATEVVRRLLATATPSTERAGDGIVNPVQAVTATLTTASPEARVAEPKREAATGGDDGARRIALLAAAVLAAAALLGVAFAVALPRGRRRRWRPGFAPLPEEHPEDDAPAPPRMLFEDWTAGKR
ncbi:S8 family serine peptidase [Cryptosporangium aurantiacum]|uniref:Subtilase family protein n=1 Tax=Cryptosporangium aurantiacum TaxID=134849 RepID=A0A1M7TXJ7_9ACTN|nr:S8 family serine peptidase [Cryptosporangium aurantiacum]SHN75430.1 Subtilase family protein [Cryptosporangium aurantiacum]